MPTSGAAGALWRWCVSSLALVALVGCASDPATTPQEEQEGSPLNGTLVSVLTLPLGSCVLDAGTPLRSDVAMMDVVDCDEPHDSELFAKLLVDESAYPGADALLAEGANRCQSAFGDFIGLPFTESTLDFTFYHPTPSSWVDGDRSIYCMAVDPGQQTTGSLLGVAR